MATTLDRDQQKVLEALLAAGRSIKDPRTRRVYERAAVQTGLVESGLRELNHGDADSQNWRQERGSIYGDEWAKSGGALNTQASAARFRDEFLQFYDPGEKSYEVAAQVQRPAAQYRGRYHDVAGQAAALIAQFGGGGGGGGGAPSGGSAPATVGPLSMASAAGAGPRADATALIQLASQPRVASSGALPAPSFLPDAYRALSSTSGPAPRQNISALIDASRTPAADGAQASAPDANTAAPPASGASTGGQGTPKAHAAFKGSYPLGATGKVIGTPNSGTHTLGNWQSDNAVDIRVAEGTPMVALQNGVVVKVRHHPQDGGRFAGDQITIRGANGNEYFYAHGIANVKAGQKIKKGQSLGVTGSANGVPHLHFGQMKGDPRKHARG